MNLTPEQKKRIEEIRRENDGILRPSDLIFDAQSELSPLYPLFEWDDAKAAHKHRLDQARAIITSVKYELKIGDSVRTTVAYVRDPEQARDTQGYAAVSDLRSDPDRAHAALVAEFKRVASMLTRARELAAVLSMDDDVDSLLDEVVKVQKKIVLSAPIAQQ